MMIRTSARFLPLTLLLIGCEAEPPTGSNASFLRAEVTGAVQASYSGTGEFWMGGSAALQVPTTFGINSRLNVSASGETVSLWVLQDGRPAVGEYQLRLPDYSENQWQSFAAVYHHRQGGSMESFVAESGIVRITASSADRVEGTFQFTGVRYCAASAADRVGSCRPTEVDPSAPRNSVSGSFVASPASYDAVTRLPGR
jgi:hypothetical protein